MICLNIMKICKERKFLKNDVLNKKLFEKIDKYLLLIWFWNNVFIN